MKSNARTPDVTIVGAGLAGSLLATMLAQRGMSVAVYEKRADMRNQRMAAGRSINLALAERGIHALKRAHLFDQVQPELVPMQGRMLHASDGTTELQKYGSREHEVIYSVSRGELNKLMLTASESHDDVSIEFDSPCVGVRLQEKTLLVGDQQNPREIAYNHLIGADGAGSPIRAAIVEERGGACSSEFLNHSYKELCIPAGQGGAYQIEREALHIWPRGGFMLIALPNSDGSFTLTLFLSNEGTPGFTELKSAEDVDAFFGQYFPDAKALIPNLTDDFANNPTGLLGTVRCDYWHFEDSALILGDAAHAIVPFHGQGMNCAFEDCAILSSMLDVSNDWRSVFDEFNSIRKPAADAIADMALENYIVMRDSVRDEKFHLKKQLEFELERRFPNQFIPRYSMVMFHRFPYNKVYSRGAVQLDLLDDLLRDVSSIENVDYSEAEKRIASWATQSALNDR